MGNLNKLLKYVAECLVDAYTSIKELSSYFSKMQIGNDLNEAAEKYANGMKDVDELLHQTIKQSFESGAKWENESILSNSIGCVVHHNGMYYIDENYDEMNDLLKKMGLDEGDEIHIAVIKKWKEKE